MKLLLVILLQTEENILHLEDFQLHKFFQSLSCESISEATLFSFERNIQLKLFIANYSISFWSCVQQKLSLWSCDCSASLSYFKQSKRNILNASQLRQVRVVNYRVFSCNPWFMKSWKYFDINKSSSARAIVIKCWEIIDEASRANVWLSINIH